MSPTELSPATVRLSPLDILALMASLLMAGDLSSGTGCLEPEFYAAWALELYLAAQERIRPNLPSDLTKATPAWPGTP